MGRDRLGPALIDLEQGKSIRLSTFTLLDDSGHRYFKNKLGGLGQYYLGSLRDLDILHGDSREIKYVTERGGVLAHAYEKRADRKSFFEAMERDRIVEDDLKRLRRFCPCYLGSSDKEQTALVDLFFNRSGQFYEPFSKTRRDTLALMLDLAAKLESTKHRQDANGFGIKEFRACTYSDSLPSGNPWEPPKTLVPIIEGWRLYGINELLSIAIQSLFWAGLAELSNQGVFPKNSEEYSRWFALTFNSAALEVDLGESFDNALERTRRTMPSLAAWTNENHEVQIGWRLAEIRRYYNNVPFPVARAALDLILDLSARVDSQSLTYIGFVHHQNYLSYYPINLDSFYSNVRNSWKNKSLQELLGWLAKDWGISAHFRVALRKLRYESRDTFKIKPTDEGLEVIDPPIPVFSNPRLAQATQILLDLGAFEVISERIVISDLGKQLLEESVHD
ncbi:MAG TPA: hypothetical protein VMZ30_12295 [Pyrinomonadaceae bacterium]|nr:hypothetical protein [Pyrinomonadaceae bacterium]